MVSSPTPPHCVDPPAAPSQPRSVTPVAGDIIAELLQPECTSRGRSGSKAARVVAVPEASVDEDDHAKSRKNNVGLAGQLFVVQAESVSHFVQQRPHHTFGTSVLAANTRHVVAALLRCQRVHGALFYIE